MKADWIIILCSAAVVVGAFSIAFLEGASVANASRAEASIGASIN